MLKIGICDMDAGFVKNLLDMLKEILYQYADWEAQVFADSNEVIRAIDEQRFDCNLLFMDIYQKQMNGVSVAEYVETKHVDTDIMFVSTSQDHVFECYRHHAYAYLLKPVREHDITTEVKRYLKDMQINPKCLNITNRGNVTKIPIDTILFIESNYRKIIVHTKNQEYEYYEKLDVLEEMLKQDGFIRCHQSYIVATDKITRCSGNTLQVAGYAVPISRKYKDNVRKYLEMAEIAVSSENAEKESGIKVDGNDKLAFGQNEYGYLTTALFHNSDNKGALVCVKGKYIGNIVRMVPEQMIIVGRDGNSADMIVNLPLVSRQHCTIIYHEKDERYEVVDQSTNGTFVDGTMRLVKGDTYLLKAGTTISFGDMGTVYKLG